MNEMFHLFQETVFSYNLCPLNGFKSDSSIFKNTLYLASFTCYRATGTLETISSKPLLQMKKWSLESQNLANLANVHRCCSDSNQGDPHPSEQRRCYPHYQCETWLPLTKPNMCPHSPKWGVAWNRGEFTT